MKNSAARPLWPVSIIGGVLLFVFFFSRFLVNTLGADNPWASYWYQYGFGFVFFTFGLILIVKTRACQFGRGRDRFWFQVLIGGFIFFALLHALWILAALRVPQLGGGG